VALGTAGLAAILLGSVALAGDPASSTAEPSAATTTTTTAPNGDKTYELKDAPDSPPVNYRSEQDPRYDTPSQHDAEMYAEQYEQKRREEAARQQRLLNSGNKIAPGGQRGSVNDGFPSGSPY